MLQGQTVTQHEHRFDPGWTLQSTTDEAGHIRYANAAFIEVSGYNNEELYAQPHRLVRHPDMPAEAFSDMWRTIRRGLSWTALVKNRRKNGDHYWVRANATPMVRDGRTVGYISVRIAPDTQEVAQAEQVYRRFIERRAHGWALHRGLLVRTGWRAWRSFLQLCSSHTRARLGLGWAIAATLAGASVGQAVSSSHAWLYGLIGAAIGYWTADQWLRHQLTRPLARIAQQAQAVASGSHVQGMALNRIDDVGMLARSVNQSGLNLRSLVDDVNVQTGGLGSAAEEIAHASQDLANRTANAASMLERTVAAMDELSGTVQHNASSTERNRHLAADTHRLAQSGGDAVRAVASSMAGISQSSQRIAEITSVIDSIAFQTNILALNASVEAARAGEAGRGFAVVASEVRALAQRSAQAAREIKSLIDESVAQVRSGRQQTEEAGRQMDEVVYQVHRMTQVMDDMATSSTEQSDGIGQIAQAIAVLEQDIQSNAALVEQTANAAAGLHSQASRLAEAVAVWRSAPCLT